MLHGIALESAHVAGHRPPDPRDGTVPSVASAKVGAIQLPSSRIAPQAATRPVQDAPLFEDGRRAAVSVGDCAEERLGAFRAGNLFGVPLRRAAPEEVGIHELHRLLVNAAVAQRNRLRSPVQVSERSQHVHQVVGLVVVAAAERENVEAMAIADLVQRAPQLGDPRFAARVEELLPQAELPPPQRADQ